MGAYHTHLGSFQSPTATGSQAVTGLGFTPKALLVWSVNTVGVPEFNDFNYWSAGLTDGTSHLAQTSITADNSNPSDLNQAIDTAAIVLAQDSAGGTQHRATLTSLDADGFTLTWTAIFSAQARRYVFLALGGDDVQVKVGVVNSATATGAQAVTGLAFQPTGLLFLPAQHAATDTNTLSYPALGWTDGVQQGAACVWSKPAVSPAVTRHYQRSDKCLVLRHATNGSLLAEAAITSLDASGYTLNWTTAPATAIRVGYLAVAGIPFACGSLTQATAPGDQLITGLGFAPGSVLLETCGLAASTVLENNAEFSLGAGSMDTQRAIWLSDADAWTNMVTARYYAEALAFAAGSGDQPTGAATTLLSSATVAMDDDGFTLTTLTNTDARPREILWAAFGEDLEAPDGPPVYEVEIGGETGITPLLSTFRIQETIDAPDTLIADVFSVEAPYFRPAVGQSVFVTENGVRIFGGSVTGVRERGLVGPGPPKIVVEVQASSYEINAKRRVVTAAFNTPTGSDTIGDAFAALVTDWYGELGVTVHPDQVAGPVLPAVAFERERGDAVNAGLAGAVGYLQSIDFENRLRAWAPGDISAPFNYDEGVNPELLTGDLEVERQLQNGYANRVILEGASIRINDQIDSFTGDGVEDTFPLTYRMIEHYGYVTANGIPENFGTAPGQWVLDTAALPHTIRRASGALPAGQVVTVKYNGLFVPEGMAEDAGEIATYGLWEHIEVVTAAPTTLSAQAFAEALLAEKLASKDEIVTLPTRALGFHPGQVMTIATTSRALTGAYLLTQVDTAAEAGDVRLWRRITAAKSLNNNHDWRRVYQQWAGASAEDTSPAVTTAPGGGGGGGGVGLHAPTHEAGGVDPVKLDDLAAPDDNTDLDVSSSAHGLAPKIGGSLRAATDGDVLTVSGQRSVWAAPAPGGEPLPPNMAFTNVVNPWSALQAFPYGGFGLYGPTAQYLRIYPEALTAQRDLVLQLNDATRSIALVGNPTLGDWFNQGVKTSDGPRFDFRVAIGTGAEATLVPSYPGLVVNATGGAQVTVRDSVAHVETAMFANVDGGIVGSMSNHNLSLRANNVTALTLRASDRWAIFDQTIWTGTPYIYVGGFQVAVTANCSIPGTGGGVTLPPNLVFYDVNNPWSTYQNFPSGISVGGVDVGGALAWLNQSVKTDASPTFANLTITTNLTLGNTLTVGTNVSAPRYDSGGETGSTAQFFLRDVSGGSMRLRFVGGVCTFFGPQVE